MSEEIEKMFSDFHEDRVQFVFDKLSANGILKDKNTKMVPKSEPFVDFFKSHGKEEVLVKIGLCKCCHLKIQLYSAYILPFQWPSPPRG